MSEDEKDVVIIEDTGETLEDLKKEFEEEKKPPEELENLKKEAQDLKEKYLRAVAEIENMKKRFLREREESRLYSMQDFLKEFLPVLDNLKRAQGEEKNIDAISEGLK
ncbi:MAG: nucleotide exchange factor GrpE, partial [Thermoanaerobaculia bacterium]